jgi:hypothetical protein
VVLPDGEEYKNMEVLGKVGFRTNTLSRFRVVDLS